MVIIIQVRTSNIFFQRAPVPVDAVLSSDVISCANNTYRRKVALIIRL